jgi:hypothetical protein
MPVKPKTTRPGEPAPVSARTTPAEASDSVSLGPRAAPRTQPTEDEIRARAYALWEQAGRPEGDGAQFWMEAEKELKTPR